MACLYSRIRPTSGRAASDQLGKSDRHGGAAVGIDDRQVKRDLERFKDFIEAGDGKTGARRGEVYTSGCRNAIGAARRGPEQVIDGTCGRNVRLGALVRC